MVKNSPINAGDMRDLGSIPGEDPLGEGIATHSSILAWRIPWTEEPSGPRSQGHKSQTRLRRVSTHAHMQYLGILYLYWLNLATAL